MKIVMRALCIVICILSAIRVEAVTHIANQDAFNEDLKAYKRLVAVVLDRSQIKGDVTQILDTLNRMLGILSNDHAYRLSRIGFATVDLTNLAQDTRTELLNALGGKLPTPITVVLFDNGSLVSTNKMPITETDVLDQEENIAHEITDALEHTWSNAIDNVMQKCDHADCSRQLSEQQKATFATDYKNLEQKARKLVQASPKQASGSRVYVTASSRPTYTYYTSPSYGSSYYQQPEYTYTYPSYSYVPDYDYYDDEDYYPYYDYPYYGGYSYGYPFFGVGFGRGRRYWGSRRWHGDGFHSGFHGGHGRR